MIINEKKYVENLLSTGEFSSEGKDAYLLVKYFYGESKDQEVAKQLVLDFMYENIDDFQVDEWKDSIASMVNTASKSDISLRDIDGVFIGNREMALIGSLDHKHLKKCLFTLTALAKIKNQDEPNQTWVDVTLNELFTYANMKSLSKVKKLEVLNQLKAYGYVDTYIVFNKTNGTRKMVYKALIAESCDDGLFVDKEESIGKLYDDHIKKNVQGWKECSVCGELYKPKSNNNTYCKRCSKVMELENTRKRVEKHRKTANVTV